MIAFGDIELDDIEDLMDGGAEVINSSDGESEAEPEGIETERNEQEPEALLLLLPSTIGIEQCKTWRLDDLAALELRLRQGQANDALHGLRMALSEKAVLFRAQVRHAKSQVKKTRAWANINAADKTVQQHFKSYSRSRQAMVRLGASDSILQRYRPLRKNDLKASTQLIDPTVPGQRNKSLPWFWVVRDESGRQNEWIHECG